MVRLQLKKIIAKDGTEAVAAVAAAAAAVWRLETSRAALLHKSPRIKYLKKKKPNPAKGHQTPRH